MDRTGFGRRAVMQGGLAAMARATAPAEAAETHIGFRAVLLDALRKGGSHRVRSITADLGRPGCTTLHVAGLGPPIWIAAHDDGMIAVGVEREGPCWDLLASFDVLATTAEGGWVNAGFAPEAEVIRPSQEAMGREDGIAGRLEEVNS